MYTCMREQDKEPSSEPGQEATVIYHISLRFGRSDVRYYNSKL
jgi:hypothetical protein